MTKKLTLIFLMAILLGHAQNGTSYKMSLQEAIAFALENNLMAKKSGRELEKAKLKKWETTAMGLPQINAGLDYQNNLVIQRNVVPAEFFGGNPGEFVDVAFGTKHVMIGRVTLSQLIFDGSYLVALQAAKSYLKFFEESQNKTTQNLKQQIIQDYTNVLLLQKSIEVLQKNKTSLEQNLFETQEFYKNGFVEEENVEQIQITLATISNSLNNTQRVLTISEQILKINLGLETNDALELTDNLEQLTQNNYNLNVLTKNFDQTSNTDYKLGELNQEQMRLLMMQERNKNYPTLYGNVNFGYNAFSNEFSFLNADQRWLNFSSINLGLNVPIFSSFGRRSKLKQAKLDYVQASDELKNLSKVLDLQFQQTKSEYEFSLEEYATSKSNLKLAERIENKQQIKFKEGLSTSFEFTEAQRQLYSAQQLYIQSMINVINKKAALDNLLGN